MTLCDDFECFAGRFLGNADACGTNGLNIIVNFLGKGERGNAEHLLQLFPDYILIFPIQTNIDTIVCLCIFQGRMIPQHVFDIVEQSCDEILAVFPFCGKLTITDEHSIILNHILK